MQEKKTVAIIGAGPAGLMAAETLATNGFAVTLFDRMPTPARKLLIAGHGGLNLTHSEPLDLFLTRYGAAQEWLAPAIRNFTPDDLRAWCEGLGQETFVGSSGRVFPRHMKAVKLLRAWLKRLEALGVHYKPRHTWQGWKGGTLCFNSPQGGARPRPDATLLALGGASWAKLGSDGSWVEMLAQKDIEIAPLRPANSGFTLQWTDHFRERFAGQPLKPVSVTHEGITRQGEAMITKRGIEGGVIYALSADIRDAILRNGTTTITLDLRPAMTEEQLQQKFAKPRGNKSLSNYLASLGFSEVAIGLIHETLPPEERGDSAVLMQHIRAIPLRLSDTTGIERAISSAGGITRNAVDEHFMLRNMEGVFVAGEMLDWEAPTGGYLLQACYATGVAAAEGIMRYCNR